jgi:hypothetical protein
MAAAKVGRNHWCPCGSGRKYKHCHGAQAGGMSLGMRIALVAGAGAIIAGLVLGFSSFSTESQPTGIWSEEHNHYH